MLFTEIEKEIARQMVKIGFIILVFFIIVTGLIKVFYWVNENMINNTVVNQKSIDQTIKPVQTKLTAPTKQEVPLSLEIPEYSISTNIDSPQSTDVKVLDESLNKSAVYYPGSGLPGSNNVLIFGHSTTFKVVINKAYEVFNNLKDVKAGTLIYVKTQDQIHVYKTREVSKVSKYTSWIQFKSEKPILTLATCDSFGKASDRWVLVADYVGVK